MEVTLNNSCGHTFKASFSREIVLDDGTFPPGDCLTLMEGLSGSLGVFSLCLGATSHSKTHCKCTLNAQKYPKAGRLLIPFSPFTSS